jgi:6-phosphogluconolactonase
VTALTVASDHKQASEVASDLLVGAISRIRRQKQGVNLVLAGGATPRQTYSLLGKNLCNWDAVELWFGDERCVSPDDPQSNYRLVKESLVSIATISPEQVHRVEVEEGPEVAADRYGSELCAKVERAPNGLPVLDIALLGLGEDGHTASIFSVESPSRQKVCMTTMAPKSPHERITLSLDVLKQTRQIFFLATGRDKADAVKKVLDGPGASVPASMLAGCHTHLVIDREAYER